MNNIFNDEYSKIYDLNNYDIKLKKVLDKSLDIFNQYDLHVLSHMDFGCGTGTFCKFVFDNGIKTGGIDISDGMINIAKEKYKNEKICFNVGNILSYKCDDKCDFISCNFDTINHLLEFADWDTFLKNVYDNLKDKGIFLFDFVTMKKFRDANEIEFSTRNNRYDYLICRVPIDQNKILSKYIYYLKYNGLYKKVEQSIVEAFFETNEIFNLIENCGFKILKKFDKNLNELHDNDSNRIYVICQKV